MSSCRKERDINYYSVFIQLEKGLQYKEPMSDTVCKADCLTTLLMRQLSIFRLQNEKLLNVVDCGFIEIE